MKLCKKDLLVKILKHSSDPCKGFSVSTVKVKIWQIFLPLVYMSCPGRAEPNIIKFGGGTAHIELSRFLSNLIIKFDLYVEPLPSQCRTY